MDKTYKRVIWIIDIILMIIFMSYLLTGCGTNEEVPVAATEEMYEIQDILDTEEMYEPQMESDSEELLDIAESADSASLTETDITSLQMMQDTVTHVNPAMISAYRELLEQEQFDWDGLGDYYNLSDMEFSFITAGDDDEIVYLLLHNSQTYLAAGTEHILICRDGEVKTIWGDGKNCIYLNGYARSEDEDSYTYISASGGTQGAAYSYLVRLSTDQADDIALYLSYPDMSSIELGAADSDYIEQYYWMEQEIERDEYQSYYDELHLEQMTDIEWIENTESNRNYVFGVN